MIHYWTWQVHLRGEPGTLDSSVRVALSARKPLPLLRNGQCSSVHWRAGSSHAHRQVALTGVREAWRASHRHQSLRVGLTLVVVPLNPGWGRGRPDVPKTGKAPRPLMA